MACRSPAPLAAIASRLAARPLAALAALLAIGGAAGPPARASDLDQFGFGARAISMGGAFTALATDFSGTYYNPGAVGAARSTSVAGGFSYAAYDLEFRGDDPRFDEEVERQQPLSALTLGLSRALDPDEDAFFNRIALALGVFLPTRQIVGPEAQTGPGRPEFFLYGARRDKLGVLPAVAFRVLPAGGIEQTLAIGIGATIFADISGKFVFDLAAAPASSVAADLKLTYDVAPNFGIFWWPVDWLSVGVAYRGALALKAEFDVVIDLDGDGASDFPLDLEALTLYQPQQVAFGIAMDPAPWLTISADVTWHDWSRFEDPFITIEPIVAQIDPDFEDIFVPRAGVEIEPRPGLAFRAGYTFQPTPIPEQRGETTLVDLGKHVASLGFGWTHIGAKERIVRDKEEFRVVEVETRPISIDAFFQWHHLVPERVRKDDPSRSPVGASFRAGGEIFNGGIQISLRF